MFCLIVWRNASPHQIKSEEEKLGVSLYGSIPGEELLFVSGCNVECTNYHESLCAERAALSRFIQIAVKCQVLGVFLVSDAAKPISPGPLCREFLCDVLGPHTFLYMAGDDCGNVGAIEAESLEDMFPFSNPPIHRLSFKLKDIYSLDDFKRKLSLLGSDAEKDEWVEMASAIHQKQVNEKKGMLVHPREFFCAIKGESINISRSVQSMEYGCSIDPFHRLLHVFEDEMPTKMVIMDSLLCVVSPNARCRSFLWDMKLLELECLVLNKEGQLVVKTVKALLPRAVHVSNLCL